MENGGGEFIQEEKDCFALQFTIFKPTLLLFSFLLSIQRWAFAFVVAFVVVVAVVLREEESVKIFIVFFGGTTFFSLHFLFVGEGRRERKVEGRSERGREKRMVSVN